MGIGRWTLGHYTIGPLFEAGGVGRIVGVHSLAHDGATGGFVGGPRVTEIRGWLAANLYN